MKLTNAEEHYLKIFYTEFCLSRLGIWKLWVQFTPFSNTTRQATYV